jgi:hypothetical protein
MSIRSSNPCYTLRSVIAAALFLCQCYVFLLVLCKVFNIQYCCNVYHDASVVSAYRLGPADIFCRNVHSSFRKLHLLNCLMDLHKLCEDICIYIYMRVRRGLTVLDNKKTDVYINYIIIYFVHYILYIIVQLGSIREYVL